MITRVYIGRKDGGTGDRYSGNTVVNRIDHCLRPTTVAQFSRVEEPTNHSEDTTYKTLPVIVPFVSGRVHQRRGDTGRRRRRGLGERRLEGLKENCLGWVVSVPNSDRYFGG